MNSVDEHGRPQPPRAGDELSTLLGFLELQRATFEWKVTGVDADGMRVTVGASTMTLGGLLKHLAIIESGWFWRALHDQEREPPWDSVDWDADPDWEWRTAADDTPEELLATWRDQVAKSRDRVALALERGGLDQLARKDFGDRTAPSLRWIICHMIEEYARHVGHADLLREAVDGRTGE